ncbi:5-(carboxyamino)imidazole ribonucleotide synthase [Neisseria sp. Ec49-e6-T10]|uniref:5-(carboxyamino)imidazole ribonucleotide synthase n=1 Tax=Neisseria sp. Ec49-e6-T10 TaxID=3140744 RepID=UPI003EBCDEA9
MKTKILPPATLGILGGGQLGRMFTIAAKTMGYKVMVLDPDPQAPAAEFADVHLCAPYDDEKALEELSSCAAVTTEFENVNAQAMNALALKTHVSPSGDSVAIAQNRILEKAWIKQAGLNTAPYLVIENDQDLSQDFSHLFPAILKTAKFGYDGKGQKTIYNQEQLQQAFKEMGSVPCVLEKRLSLHCEISAIVTRTSDIQIECFPVAENQHKNGILDICIVPARIEQHLQQQAQQMAKQLANELNYIGVLAVEFFVLEDMSLIINEIAPRPHNSGHYTLNACLADQFQQQVRAMCHLAPAKTTLLSPCVMVNILGDSWHDDGSEPQWFILQEAANAHLHLYGKKEARKGRKMGHFTVLSDTNEQALEQAQALQMTL